MGEVYLAEQDAPRRKVALKLLSPELSLDAGFRERFARESEAAASIDHPNVIPIYQSGQADGGLFIAMRYVEGTDLRTLLAEQGPLPPRTRRPHLRPGRRCAGGRARTRSGPPRRQARQHPDRQVRSRLPLGLRPDPKDGGLLGHHQDRPVHGHARLRLPRAVRGQAARSADRCLLARVRLVRMPGRRAAVPQGAGRRRDVRPSPRSTTERTRGDRSCPRVDQVIEKAMAKRPVDRFATAGELATALKGAKAGDPLPRLGRTRSKGQGVARRGRCPDRDRRGARDRRAGSWRRRSRGRANHRVRRSLGSARWVTRQDRSRDGRASLLIPMRRGSTAHRPPPTSRSAKEACGCTMAELRRLLRAPSTSTRPPVSCEIWPRSR